MLYYNSIVATTRSTIHVMPVMSTAEIDHPPDRFMYIRIITNSSSSEFSLSGVCAKSFHSSRSPVSCFYSLYYCLLHVVLVYHFTLKALASLKPQSHIIVRFLDRTIGCDWAKVRPIGNFCYDLQQRSTRCRAITNDWRISMTRVIAGNRATSGSDQISMYDK